MRLNDSFERFRRPDDMTISDSIHEFERLLNKIKRYGSDMSTDILAYSYSSQLTFQNSTNS